MAFGLVPRRAAASRPGRQEANWAARAGREKRAKPETLAYPRWPHGRSLEILDPTTRHYFYSLDISTLTPQLAPAAPLHTTPPETFDLFSNRLRTFASMIIYKVRLHQSRSPSYPARRLALS
jgi:hypothetical protein